MFVGQSGLMNFTISVNGGKCKAPEKRVGLQLEDKSVFSAVVEIENNEIVFNKVIQLNLINVEGNLLYHHLQSLVFIWKAALATNR